MKKFIKVLIVLTSVLLLCSCNTNSTSEDNSISVGIIQYMSHPSLDNCFNGIIDALDESGIDYKVTYQIGSSASADSDCITYAKNMVSDNCDIILTIATNSSKAAFAATDETDIPVVFCAVSDPVAAKLVDSLEHPGYLCTGTSDELAFDAQVDLIQTLQPNVKKIGILYTSSEDNSLSHLKAFTEICSQRNIEVVSIGVQNSSDIPSAAEELASKVDCINNFTDNNVVNNLSVVLSSADKYGIPVYGSEETQVKRGCLAAVSIDYTALGKVTGNIAVDIIKGADPTSYPVKKISEAIPVINSDVIDSLQLSIPEKYEDAVIVVTE